MKLNPAIKTSAISNSKISNWLITIRTHRSKRRLQSSDCIARRATDPPQMRPLPSATFSRAWVEEDVKGLWGALILLSVASSASAQDESPYRVEIDLQQQRAYLIRGRRAVMESPISSGRYGHLTETGSFKVIEKELNHHSSIYGKIVDAYGRTVVADADVDMKVPHGGRFIPAPMRYFMRFHGADGMHAGYLPAIRHRTDAFACPNNSRSHFSMR